MSRGSQHKRSAKRNWPTNSDPYGYGGRRADTIVFPVRIIMSPTSSSRLFAGANARSATVLTTRSRTSPLATLGRTWCQQASRTAASLCDCRHACQTGTVDGSEVPPALRDTSLWYVPAAVEGSRRAMLATGVAAITAAGFVTGCGGGDRQDAHEPSGPFQV